MPACLCVGQTHPHGHKVPIRPGRGEVSRGAGACRAEPARSPAPPHLQPCQLGSLQGARVPRAVTAPWAGHPQKPLQAAVSSATRSARPAELPPGDQKPGPTNPAWGSHCSSSQRAVGKPSDASQLQQQPPHPHWPLLSFEQCFMHRPDAEHAAYSDPLPAPSDICSKHLTPPVTEGRACTGSTLFQLPCE